MLFARFRSDPVQVATAQLANIEVQGALGDGIEAE
jgi:hypothetical protein